MGVQARRSSLLLLLCMAVACGLFESGGLEAQNVLGKNMITILRSIKAPPTVPAIIVDGWKSGLIGGPPGGRHIETTTFEC